MSALALYLWLAAHGCSAACGAGIVANLDVESRLTPCVVGRSGIGLPQWAGSRRRHLLARLGRDWCNPDKQLAFMLDELIKMGLAGQLFAMTNPAAATRLFFFRFERPRSKNPEPREQRAWRFYRLFAGGR